jgi:hypothetical protein
VVEIHIALSLAGFAALVRHAQKFTGEKLVRPPWEWGVATIHVGTGAFVGLLTHLAIGATWEVRYAYVAIALAGYGGPLTLDFAWKTGTEVAASFFARAAQKISDKNAKD